MYEFIQWNLVNVVVINGFQQKVNYYSRGRFLTKFVWYNGEDVFTRCIFCISLLYIKSAFDFKKILLKLNYVCVCAFFVFIKRDSIYGATLLSTYRFCLFITSLLTTTLADVIHWKFLIAFELTRSCIEIQVIKSVCSIAICVFFVHLQYIFLYKRTFARRLYVLVGHNNSVMPWRLRIWT